MSFKSLVRWPYLLVWVVILRLSASEEVCCCPNLNVFITCKEEDGVSKLLNNNYRCAVQKGEDVDLQCQLQDADHEAVKRVDYKFHKTGKFTTAKIISAQTDPAQERVCSSTTDSSTCTITSVRWKKKEGVSAKDEDMTDADNQFYQCAAEVTLVDGTKHTIVSRTLFLDVVFEPDILASQSPFTKTESVNIGFPDTQLKCDLPSSNPPTQPKWTYKGNEIDIKNSTRSKRLAIMEEDTDERGTLIIMSFTPAEDEGEYKCHGVYTDPFTVTSKEVDLLSEYTITSSGNQNNAHRLFKAISSKAKPTLVDKDSSISFTTYFRDSLAVVDGVPKPDLTYHWEYFNDQKIDGSSWAKIEPVNEHTKDLLTNKYVQIMNKDRTLEVSNIYELFAGVDNKTVKFKCKALGDDNVVKDGVDFGQGTEHPLILILPEEFDIPVTSEKCINKVEDITTVVNQEYMRTVAKDGIEPKQLLINNDFNYFFNGVKLSVLGNAGSATMLKDKSLTYPVDNFERSFESFKDSRCLYFQYMSTAAYKDKISAGYQLMDTAMVDRSESGCTDIPETVKDNAKITCDGTTLSLTLNAYTTTQCVAVHLEYDGTVVSEKKYFPKVANTCTGREMSLSFTASDLKQDIITNLTKEFDVKLSPVFGGKQGFSSRVSCGGDPDNGMIIVAAVAGVVLLLLLIWLLFAFLYYTGYSTLAVYPSSWFSDTKKPPKSGLKEDPEKDAVTFSKNKEAEGAISLNQADGGKETLYDNVVELEAETAPPADKNSLVKAPSVHTNHYEEVDL